MNEPSDLTHYEMKDNREKVKIFISTVDSIHGAPVPSDIAKRSPFVASEERIVPGTLLKNNSSSLLSGILHGKDPRCRPLGVYESPSKSKASIILP